MPLPKEFKFQRSRGIVWVCDIEASSKYLNSSQWVTQLEDFLPRFYWVSSIIVESAGGKFLKWTGDGFLAWFDVALHREIPLRAKMALEALWHLSCLVNVTQLGVKSDRRFKIRHGLTYEHDALIIEIDDGNGVNRIDIIGRAVVLAFRLSGISAKFPHVVAQGEIVSAYKDQEKRHVDFRAWRPNKEDRVRYFKNERWGTRSLYVSVDKKIRSPSIASVLRGGKRAIALAEGERAADATSMEFVSRFLHECSQGPDWCQEALNEYTKFIRDDVLGSLRKVIVHVESQWKDGRKKRRRE